MLQKAGLLTYNMLSKLVFSILKSKMWMSLLKCLYSTNKMRQEHRTQVQGQ